MNPIALLFGLVLLAVSVLFVVSPYRYPALKKKSTHLGIPQQDGPKISPEKQRQSALLALRDLDFDYQAGKVAEEDYQNLRANLVNETAQLMQSQDRRKEASIEAMIQSRRQARSAAQPNLQEHPAIKGKAHDVAAGQAEKRCYHCQSPLLEGAKFCSKCGSPVGEMVCPKCKQPLQTGDHFCPICGTAVNQENKIIKQAARPEGE